MQARENKTILLMCLTFNKQPTMVEAGISVLDIQQTTYNGRSWYVCVWHSTNNLQWLNLVCLCLAFNKPPTMVVVVELPQAPEDDPQKR